MKHEHKEEQEPRDDFEAFTAVMDTEQLIRFRRRFQKRGWDHMVKRMDTAIEQQEEAEKAEHKKKKDK